MSGFVGVPPAAVQEQLFQPLANDWVDLPMAQCGCLWPHHQLNNLCPEHVVSKIPIGPLSDVEDTQKPVSKKLQKQDVLRQSPSTQALLEGVRKEKSKEGREEQFEFGKNRGCCARNVQHPHHNLQAIHPSFLFHLLLRSIPGSLRFFKGSDGFRVIVILKS